MSIVAFNSTSFKARYPEFNSVQDATLQAYFDEAGLYLSNADNSPVQNITRRAVLLNMLTAHIAALNGALNNNQALPVGRVASASEGSVSASMEYLAPGSHSWFTQSTYGSSFWQATVSLRGFRYISKPTVY